MEHLTEQDLVLLALDEPVTSAAGVSARDHLDHCDQCAAELAAFRHTVELGRESAADRGPTAAAPPRLWEAIADELGDELDGPPAPPSVSAVPAGPGDRRAAAADSSGAVEPPADRSRARTWWIAAAVVAAVLVGIGGGIVIGRTTAGQTASVTTTASAQLAAVEPAAPPQAAGNATVTVTADGATLTVDTDHLPLVTGFYQVWLYDKSAENMVPIGTLDSTGRGSFTLAPTIDIRSFNIVDVSAQLLNGDPAHGTSVLQGTLTS